MNSFFMTFVFQLLNWSPILHASIDSQFGAIDKGIPNRYSLLGLSFGKRKVYIFSVVKSQGSFSFKFFDHIFFDSLCAISSDLEINSKVDSYQEYLSNKNDDLIRNQIEFLKDKISLNQSRTASGYNKTNSYTTIVLVYIGFIAYLLEQVVNLSVKAELIQYLVYILTSLSIYYAFNCIVFIKSALLIKGYIRATFRDIKEDPSLQKLACSYYTDWYSTNNESQVITSLVANIEKYFTRSFSISLFIWIILFTDNHHESTKKHVTNQTDEYLIFNELGEFQKSVFVRFLSNIGEDNESIFIVSNKTDVNGSIVSDFIKSTVSNSERVIEIHLENDVMKTNSVIIKHKD